MKKQQNKNDDYLTLANKRYNDNKNIKQQNLELIAKKIEIEYAKLSQKQHETKYKHIRAIISTITAIITFIVIILTIILITK